MVRDASPQRQALYETGTKTWLCHFPRSATSCDDIWMDAQVWPVAGGFHARDSVLRLTAYGKTEQEAIQNLEEARRRARRLGAVVLASSGPREHEGE